MSDPRLVESQSCTAQEWEVLSMIKVGPGVPAVVTYSPETGWSVGTRPEDVERRICGHGLRAGQEDADSIR